MNFVWNMRYWSGRQRNWLVIVLTQPMDLTRPDFVLNVLFHQKEINCAVLDAPPSHIYQGIQRKIIPKPHRPKKKRKKKSQ